MENPKPGTYIYLASPYTHSDPAVMEARFIAACRAAGRLMAEGHQVFSPIAHTHPIAVQCELPRDWGFWKKYDETMIAHAHKLVVLVIDGWRESKGVAAEIAIAIGMGIPVESVLPEPTNDEGRKGNKMGTAWIVTGDKLPPEDVTVLTKIDDTQGCRNEMKLAWHGGIWFFPDSLERIYYEPTHWSYLPVKP